MRRSTLAIALIVPMFAWPAAGRAAAVHLEGRLIQGGVIFGTTDPGAHVTLDGRSVRVAPDGRFVFGFGRDASDHAALEVVLPDGTQEERQLTIESRVYKVQRIDGLPEKQVTPPADALARIHADAERVWAARSVDRPVAYFESGFIWPATGPISGVFGSQRILNGKPRQPHFGVDIAAPEGSAVVAPADGVVTMAARDLYYTGGTVVLDHGHGLTTTYSHLKAVLVKEGQVLHQGDMLGRIGATGRATGPHLDWRVNWFDVRMDPEFLVPPMPKTAAKTQ